ncbi:MAG: substrate-binding domain-containing protein [Ignisphaera sp.]
MDYDDIVIRFDVVIEYKGYKVLDRRVASIFKMLKERGSMLSASRALGIPYSKIYDIIARIERITGKKIVEAKRGGRGGGGVVLTEFGEKLISLYEIALTKLIESGLSSYSQSVSREKGLAVAHSHDPVLSVVFSTLSRDGVEVNSMCLGSGLSLAMLSLELVDVACIHLYDPESKTYNTSYLDRFWLTDRVEHIGGYQREIVFIYRADLKFKSIEDILHGIVTGELVIASRNRGSGTRLLLESLLKDYTNRYSLDSANVRGIGKELYTHDDVAELIKRGEADVGLTLRYVADRHGLKYMHVTWELYECYALKSRSNSYIDKFKNILHSQQFKSILTKIPGYRPYTI